MKRLLLALLLLASPASASLLFNGTTDVVTGPSYTNGNLYTIAAWAYATSLGGGSQGTIALHGAFGAANARVFFALNNATNVSSLQVYSQRTITHGQWCSPASSIVLSTWQHLAMTYDGSLNANVPVLYINGAAVSRTTIATPNGTIATEPRVIYGGNDPAVIAAFAGRLGEWAVWNRILSAPEIAAVYLLGVLAVPNGLTIYWPMSGSVANAVDFSGNARHGTLTGTALAADPPAGQRKGVYYLGRYRPPTLWETIRLGRWHRGGLGLAV
jgi:hypothetical protein